MAASKRGAKACGNVKIACLILSGTPCIRFSSAAVSEASGCDVTMNVHTVRGGGVSAMLDLRGWMMRGYV